VFNGNFQHLPELELSVMATEDHPPGPTDTDDDLDFLVPANSQPVRRGDTEVVKRSKQIANGLHKRQEAVERTTKTSDAHRGLRQPARATSFR